MKKSLFIVFAILLAGCSGVQVREDKVLKQPTNEIEILGPVESSTVETSEFQILGPVEMPEVTQIEEKTEPVEIQVIGPVEMPNNPPTQIKSIKESARKYVTFIKQVGDKIQGRFVLMPWEGMRIAQINEMLGVKSSDYGKYLVKSKNRNFFVKEGVPIVIHFEISKSFMASMEPIHRTSVKSVSSQNLQHNHKVVWKYASDVQTRDNKITGIYTIIPEKGMKIAEINRVLGVTASQYKAYLVKAANGNSFVREGVPIRIPFEFEMAAKGPANLKQTNKSPPERPDGERRRKGGDFG